MRWRPLLVLVLVTSLVAACGDDDDAATDDTTTTTEAVTTTETTASTTTTTEAPASTGAEVTLLDPGAEPRQELRYQAQEGTTDGVTQRNQLTLVQEFGGQRQELPIPASSIDVDYVAESVDDGAITVVGTYGEARVEGEGVAAAETERLLGEIAGARLVTEMTDRGAITSSRLDGVDTTGNPVFDQLASSLVDNAASLAFPFPDEPVGVGARWAVDTDLELSGLPISARYVVTLTELDGDQVRGAVEASLSFVPGRVEVQGTTAEVVSGELAGDGTVEWDLAGGLVPRTTLEMAGTVTIDVQGTRIVQEQTQSSSVVARG